MSQAKRIAKCGAAARTASRFAHRRPMPEGAPQGRVHDPQRREQPCPRLRTGGDRQRRSPRCGRRGSRAHGPAGRDRCTSSTGGTRLAFIGVAPYRLGAGPARHRRGPSGSCGEANRKARTSWIVTMHAGAEGAGRAARAPGGRRRSSARTRGNPEAFAHAVDPGRRRRG